MSGSSSTSRTVWALIAGEVSRSRSAASAVFLRCSSEVRSVLSRGWCTGVMSKFSITLTAAAVSALVAAATVALPAIGDDSGSPAGPAKSGDELPAFAACLRDHGLQGAPTVGEELKPWLARQETADPQATKAAIEACQAQLPQKPVERKPVDVSKLATCLRAHGFDAPSDPAAFKAWFARKEADDAKAIDGAIADCKMTLAGKPGGPAKPGDCGDAT
jgi:hypothetical protein